MNVIYTEREIATMPAAELLRLNKAIDIALFEGDYGSDHELRYEDMNALSQTRIEIERRGLQ